MFPYRSCIVPETYRKKTLAARIELITEASTSNQQRSQQRKKKNWPETAAFIFPPTSILAHSPPHAIQPGRRKPTSRPPNSKPVSSFHPQSSRHLFSELFAIWLFIGHRHFALPGPVRFLLSLPFSAAAHAPRTHRAAHSHSPYSSTS